MNDKYVVVPREDWEGILDSVRGKTGKTARLKSGEVSPEIDGIETGGGSGGGGGTEGYITFYDYDGTIVTSWTKEQLEAATELPENPEHEGLTAQGWNWTLDELKAEGAGINVGQMYIPTDGKTHVFIELEEERREIRVGLAVNGTVEIDFGDGSAPVTLTGTNISTVVVYTDDHKYPAAGKYEVKIEVTSGKVAVIGSSSGTYLISPPEQYSNNGSLGAWASLITEVWLGMGLSHLNHAFHTCRQLKSVIIPKYITSNSGYAFYNCYSLKFAIINISTNYYYFRSCVDLETVSYSKNSLIDEIHPNMFDSCRKIKRFSIPKSIKEVRDRAFNSCEQLLSVDIPNTVNSIGQSAFSNCVLLSSIKIPEGVTTISNSMFSSCYSITEIVIPESAITIGTYVFQNCYALKAITVPKGVNSIGNGCFAYNGSLIKVYMEPETPPTLGINVFNNCHSDLMIIVNPGCVDEYIAATNWSAEAAKIYSEHNVSFTWGSGVLRLIDPPEKLYYNSSTPYENIIRAEFDPDYAFDGAYDINGQGVEVTLGDMTDGEGGTIIAELHAVITDPDADDFEIYIASM